VEGRYFFTAGDDGVEATGTEVVEMLGPYWRRGSLEVELPGSTVQGMTVTGFDPRRQVFLSTWIDSSNPYLYAYEGSYDEEESTLHLIGLNVDPGTGKKTSYQSIERFAFPDRRALELFVGTGDDAFRILQYRYERIA